MKRNRLARGMLLFAAILIFCFAVSGAYLLGKNSGKVEEVPGESIQLSPEEPIEAVSLSQTGPVQKLNISVVPNDSPHSILIPPEELGNQMDTELSYHGVKDVTIQLSDQSVPLEEAIRDGRITPEEIIAYAKIDARNGFCRETLESKLGLTQAFYRYRGFLIRAVQDVFEMPDGTQHPVFSLSIHRTKPNYHMVGSLYEIDENGSLKYLGWEDWGLTFEIEALEGSVITVKCTQSGGDHFGSLQVESYDLVLCEENDVRMLQPENRLQFKPIALPSESSGSFTLDFSEQYSDIPAGNYYILLHVQDIFGETHKFMKDYATIQGYKVYFSIT